MRKTLLLSMSLIVLGCTSSPDGNEGYVRVQTPGSTCTLLNLETSGVVLVVGGYAHKELDGSVRVESLGEGRDVEVHLDGSRVGLVHLEADYPRLGGVYGAGITTRGNVMLLGDNKVDAEAIDSKDQSGSVNCIHARSVTISNRVGGVKNLLLKDAVLGGAAAPIGDVGVICRGDE